MLGVKETNKYLEIFEADTIKEVEMKKKIKDCISDKQENFSKPNFTGRISSKR